MDERYIVEAEGGGYLHRSCAGIKDEPGYVLPPLPDVSDTQNTPVSTSYLPPKTSAIGILKFFAYANLIIGIIGALCSWIFYSTVHIPTMYGEVTKTNTIGVILVFIFLIEGLFGWALFYVIVNIADNVHELRKQFIEKF